MFAALCDALCSELLRILRQFASLSAALLDTLTL
jgi:hypothetical protein